MFCHRSYTGDDDLASAIYNFGPIAITMNAQGLDFLKGPILPGGWCNNTPPVNHGVLGVGWDETYWIIKNSWGTDWGVNGYLKVPKNNSDNCLIYNEGTVPFLF